ncbi:MAG: hypothetical protein E6K73_13860 [Candidatus Eisenbacteria bacterium]|uniref:Uncharacterized protein n=1 Tax=Eiseniibacteriota bacterium TaxID=2212470 RepID=A0A538S7G3_UNCEI|nr:MAG: hypothetical protein E6K73_13860 [Candidatus Eisenbacteria bacterium]
MADDPVVAELKRIWLAIQSLNPDPAATIQAYRDQKAAQQRAADNLVTATEALVGATRHLSRATWILVVLTALMVIAQFWPLIPKGGR